MLFAGTVPANKEYVTGTVPANKEYAPGTVSANKEYAAGKIKTLKFQNISPTSSIPISAAQKVPVLCQEVEKNPEPCNIATLAIELSLL